MTVSTALGYKIVKALEGQRHSSESARCSVRDVCYESKLPPVQLIGRTLRLLTRQSLLILLPTIFVFYQETCNHLVIISQIFCDAAKSCSLQSILLSFMNKELLMDILLGVVDQGTYLFGDESFDTILLPTDLDFFYIARALS